MTAMSSQEATAEPPSPGSVRDAPSRMWVVAAGSWPWGALLLGAQEAVGVDIDPTARTASRAVASANGVGERYEFRDGGIAPLCHRGQCFDVVVANVLIPVIEEHGRDLQAMCRPGGAIVVSGLLVDQRDRALAALEPSEVMREYSSDGWVTLVMTNRTGGRR
ncbi:MAG: 50S ribosomal protein L11 methyltransferase [Microthrixaceae bacterium]|nr:50S ribosomal protein L11 methyltransferase [Microthrixaceae bacterium]